MKPSEAELRQGQTWKPYQYSSQSDSRVAPSYSISYMHYGEMKGVLSKGMELSSKCSRHEESRGENCYGCMWPTRLQRLANGRGSDEGRLCLGRGECHSFWNELGFLRSCSVSCGGTLGERGVHNAQHVFSRGRLSRPDFKLARCLVHEHLAAWYNFSAALFGQLQ